jgi:integrase
VANRALELLRVMYTWATSAPVEDPEAEPLLPSSPVTGVKPFEEKERKRTLSSDELRGVWWALEGEPFGDALRLLLWTGTRKSEVLGAEWSEFDFKTRLWTVPATRSKTGEARRVPLSTPALEMLRERHGLEPETRWLFPSPVGHVGPVRSLQALLRRVQKSSGVTGWTLHDCRRVVRSGLSALGVAPPVSEFILGHLPPRMVRTYDRHEPLAEAAAALEAWARRLEIIVSGETGAADVVPFGRRHKEMT